METETLRDMVIAELARRRMSRYALAQSVRKTTSATIVYEWLAGKRDIQAEHLGAIFDALGLTLTTKSQRAKTSRTGTGIAKRDNRGPLKCGKR